MSERSVVFGSSGTLVGVTTQPDTPSSGAPGFILLNAGLLHRIGPHRLSVELARALAVVGIASIRFDFSGIGDSGPRSDGMPARMAAVDETREAMQALQASTGTGRFVIVGLCSGADAAFRTAVADPRVVGAILIDGPPYRTPQFFLRHYARRLMRPASWRNVLSGRHPLWASLGRRGADGQNGHPARVAGGGRLWPMPTDRDIPPRREAQDMLRALVDRGVELCIVYTGGYSQFVNAARQFGEMFPGVTRSVRVEHLADTDHTFTMGSHRERLLAVVHDWCVAARWLAAAATREPLPDAMPQADQAAGRT